MDYLQAFPSQMGIKGRFWQTNVFQDGSHETHLVFKVAGFKGMFELGRFSHLLSPLLIWERVAAPPRPLSCSGSQTDGPPLATLGDCFLETSKDVPGVGGWHFLLAKFHFIFFLDACG